MRGRRFAILAIILFLVAPFMASSPAFASSTVYATVTALEYGLGSNWTTIPWNQGFTVPAGDQLRAVLAAPIPSGDTWGGSFYGQDWYNIISGNLSGGISDGSSYVSLSPPFSVTMGYQLTSLEIWYVAAVPPVPTGVIVGSVTGSSAAVSWSGSLGATDYLIYVNGTEKASDVTGTSYLLSGLTAGEKYTVQIEAANSNGASGLSAAVTFYTPTVPSGLSHSGVTASEFTETWNPVAGATSYNIYFNRAKVASSSGSTYGFSGLNQNTTYSVTVSAVVNGVVTAQSTADSVTTVEPTLVSPENVIQSGSSGATGNISWTSVPSATSYDIYDNGQLIGTSTTTSFTVQNYDPNAVYSVVAQAPNFSSSPSSSQYGNEMQHALALGFTPGDLVQNAVALIMGVGSLLLLVLTIMFAPRLLYLLRRSASSRGTGEQWEYFDPVRQDWVLERPVRDLNEITIEPVKIVPIAEISDVSEVPPYDYRVNVDQNFETDI